MQSKTQPRGHDAVEYLYQQLMSRPMGKRWRITGWSLDYQDCVRIGDVSREHLPWRDYQEYSWPEQQRLYTLVLMQAHLDKYPVPPWWKRFWLWLNRRPFKIPPFPKEELDVWRPLPPENGVLFRLRGLPTHINYNGRWHDVDQPHRMPQEIVFYEPMMAVSNSPYAAPVAVPMRTTRVRRKVFAAEFVVSQHMIKEAAYFFDHLFADIDLLVESRSYQQIV